MRLTRAHVPDYLELLRPSRDPEDAEARVARVLAFMEEPTFAQRIHVATHPDGGLAVALGAHAWLPDTWQALVGWRADDASASALEALTASWREDLLTLPEPPPSLLARVDLRRMTPAHERALVRSGWKKEGGRVEFKTPVEALPLEDGTPLQWRDLSEVGLDEAARVFGLAGVGPDWDDDDPHALIPGYLSEEGLTNTPDCIQVGYLDEVPVAFVVAQTESESGWCTLPFMGVVQGHRTQGLGVWVHRHGLAMLRAQGGQMYHGGTSAQNEPMLRLFERNGCALHAHMEEWRLRLRSV